MRRFVEKTPPAVPAMPVLRAVKTGKALLLFLSARSGGLRGLRFDHALLELVHAPCRVHELLLAGVKRMAGVTYTHDDDGLGRAGLDHVAARATDFRIHIFRMYISFHKRPDTIPLVGRMASGKIVQEQAGGEYYFFSLRWRRLTAAC